MIEDTSKELDLLRLEIDSIDEDMRELLNERMLISEKVALCKASLGMPVFDREREDFKISEIKKKSTPDIVCDNLKLYELVSELSKNRQGNFISAKRFALIGKNIDHSLSADVHHMIGRCRYDIVPLESEADIPEILSDTRYSGFNITSPYKRKVIKYLDGMSKCARRVGAINTIRRTEGGKLIGYNTDVYGFKQMMRHVNIKAEKVLIFGSGGAAAAVCEGMRQLGASYIVVASRNPDRAARRLGRLASKYISYSEVKEHTDVEIIVNATPVGMYPRNGVSLLSLANIEETKFTSLKLAADLIYDPYRTHFLMEFEKLGKSIISGIPMLVWQGLESEKVWGILNDNEIDFDTSESIIRKCMMKRLNLTLVGMPGSGKSSVARRVAEKMKRTFIDTDRAIMAYTGKSIQAVLRDRKRGEKYLRKAETTVIARECRESGKVIATGGGAVLRKVNRNCIRENSVVIYVKRPLHLLSTRNRPLSKREGVEALYKKRSGLYERVAEIIIENNREFGRGDERGQDTYSDDIDQFAREIIRAFNAEVAELAKGASRREPLIGEDRL